MEDLRETLPERRWECLEALESPLAEEWVRRPHGPQVGSVCPPTTRVQAHPGVGGSFLGKVCWFSLGFLKTVCFIDLDKNFWSLEFFIDIYSITFLLVCFQMASFSTLV